LIEAGVAALVQRPPSLGDIQSSVSSTLSVTDLDQHVPPAHHLFALPEK
jgi:hypothetical protein